MNTYIVMKKLLTIFVAAMIICVFIIGISFNLSCKSSNGSIDEVEQTAITLVEVIHEVFEANPRPQTSYIISGFVKKIDNRSLLIERVDNPMVIADIDLGIRIETLNEFAQGLVYKPMLFEEILVGDIVKLWVQIMSDGSFSQTRLLVNVQ